jgi:serine/threonine-protein kinase
VARQAKLAGDLQVALERAELFHHEGKRSEALAAFERAELLAEEARDPDLRQRLLTLKVQLDAEAQDQDFVARYEAIRLLEQSQVNEQTNYFSAMESCPKIKEVLHQYGIEVGVSAPTQAVARIQGRPEGIQVHLLSALYECLITAPDNDAQTRQWLVAVLNDADGDPWRTQVRKAAAAEDWQALEQLARQVDVQKQRPSFLLLVAWTLGDESEATSLELLRRIQSAYPADFWANHDLAFALATGGQPAEALRYYTAALALRPHNPGVYVNRAIALKAAGELDAAIADLRQALAVAPGFAQAHFNLGLVQIRWGAYELRQRIAGQGGCRGGDRLLPPDSGHQLQFR